MRFLDKFDNINWNDYEQSCVASQDFLLQIAGDKTFLSDLLNEASQDSNLRGKCEKYDLMTKLVLYEGANETRLRLHVFHDDYFDRPHNHRWAYTSNIIHGSYIHRLFISEKAALNSSIEDLTLTKYELRKVNQPYSLNNNIFHSITSNGVTVTMIVRGPAKSDTFRVMDRVSGEVWNQQGAENESEEERRIKQLTNKDLEKVKELLQDLELIHG